jgi:putative N6-adenine-specific DNA methylase
MSQRYFAQVSPGLESLLKAELKTLGARKLKLDEGGVHFEGTRKHLYRALQWSRLANLIYWTVSEGTAPNAHALFERVMKVPWDTIVPQDSNPMHISIRVSLSRHPEFQGTGQVESIVFRAIERSLSNIREVRSAHWNDNKSGHHLRILVRAEDHRVTIRLDAAGRLLHKRGWRLSEGDAPLRPTLAAAMLKLLQWQPNEPLIDPMCGSGTLPIEAALMAANASPRLWNTYACHQWVGFDEILWQAEGGQGHQPEHASSESIKYHTQIFASDHSSEAISLTQQHCTQAKQMVQVSCLSVDRLAPPITSEKGGLIIFNPPYGLRVNEGDETKSLLRRFAQHPQAWAGWRVGMIYPRQLTPPAPNGLVARELARFQHGGLPVWVWQFTHLG